MSNEYKLCIEEIKTSSSYITLLRFMSLKLKVLVGFRAIIQTLLVGLLAVSVRNVLHAGYGMPVQLACTTLLFIVPGITYKEIRILKSICIYYTRFDGFFQ